MDVGQVIFLENCYGHGKFKYSFLHGAVNVRRICNCRFHISSLPKRIELSSLVGCKSIGCTLYSGIVYSLQLLVAPKQKEKRFNSNSCSISIIADRNDWSYPHYTKHKTHYTYLHSGTSTSSSSSLNSSLSLTKFEMMEISDCWSWRFYYAWKQTCFAILHLCISYLSFTIINLLHNDTILLLNSFLVFFFSTYTSRSGLCIS